MSTGCLHLLPVGLGLADPTLTHPAGVLQRFDALDYFIAERAKTARAELKRLGYSRPIQEAEIHELPERPDSKGLALLLEPLFQGRNGGLVSEAGCPAVADPGALVVREAHRLGIRVIPHIGPSSLLLALMASGLNGQSFAFHGYLPQKTDERLRAINQLERESAKLRRTQLFIETPYRNAAMFASLLDACSPQTLVCVARGLSTASEWIMTRSAADWKRQPAPDLERQPTVFLLLA
ncbi:MAG: SAM-dependent methyltransferase [Candidatus Dactylopiibacterium carminicum]|uniref:SAM-dependent methyltransferase n=1 Tax=Candidatus Dactylopiibacterium carminicum TaxID=857335 RepID=A0A272ESX7_9RHOO|nr:SAM-dependent methyltransferase [Candidatus Dactylopiibacterium carminicum]KAF7599103.1 SAM-dependent methyltransferase [Candidatus Dactylopiibacterium carminicum]PAS93136.1 MAG: SAM-dependent methyltransferase [Candidatus Dactylopiibacterium carminicum]PAS99116.1 MAG: SAM-dependent methyltransferase [Candidatus Dactylopiibacterium carminicum]